MCKHECTSVRKYSVSAYKWLFNVDWAFQERREDLDSTAWSIYKELKLIVGCPLGVPLPFLVLSCSLFILVLEISSVPLEILTEESLVWSLIMGSISSCLKKSDKRGDPTSVAGRTRTFDPNMGQNHVSFNWTTFLPLLRNWEGSMCWFPSSKSTMVALEVGEIGTERGGGLRFCLVANCDHLHFLGCYVFLHFEGSQNLPLPTSLRFRVRSQPDPACISQSRCPKQFSLMFGYKIFMSRIVH